MNRKRIGLAVVMGALATASFVALADPPQHIQPRPREPQECICPQNYQPVKCVAADGSVHVFSNACVAGCAGFTNCSPGGLQ